MSKIDENLPFIAIRIAVLTVSDTRTEKDDKSGDLLAGMITSRAIWWPRAVSFGMTLPRSVPKFRAGSPILESTWSSPPAVPGSPAAM